MPIFGKEQVGHKGVFKKLQDCFLSDSYVLGLDQ